MRYSKVYYFYQLLIPFIFTLIILYSLEYKFFISSLSKLEHYIQKKNIKFYFVYLPSFYRYKIGREYIDQTFQTEITQFLAENDVNLIDIDKEVFSKIKNPLSLFPYGTRGHYNEKGYELISEIIYKNVKKPI